MSANVFLLKSVDKDGNVLWYKKVHANEIVSFKGDPEKGTGKLEVETDEELQMISEYSEHDHWEWCRPPEREEFEEEPAELVYSKIPEDIQDEFEKLAALHTMLKDLRA